MIIPHSILFRMRNVSEKVEERVKTNTFSSRTLSESRAVYEIMWKNMVEPDRPQMTITYSARPLLAVTKATNTHSEYLI